MAELSSVQRILMNILGGMIGFAVGLIIISFKMEYFEPVKGFIVVNSSVIGILVSVIVIDYLRQKELRQHNKVRAETISLITHEMRTGLTSTGWAIDLIIKRYGDKIAKSDHELLESISNSIHAIIEHSVNLLDISLIDTKKLHVFLELVSFEVIESMFNDSMTKYTLGAERNGIDFTYSIKLSHNQFIEADIVRLRVILESLIENAFQYTVYDEKKVKVLVRNDSKSLLMEVSDTGIGIPEAEKPKIFSEFFRATNATKILASGSGIGLYLTKQYVEAHHGIIHFTSTEGKGTTFYVSIPLKTAVDVHEFAEKI